MNASTHINFQHCCEVWMLNCNCSFITAGLIWMLHFSSAPKKSTMKWLFLAWGVPEAEISCTLSAIQSHWYKTLIHQQQPENNQQSMTQWHSTEQCPLQWDILGPVKTTHLNKMLTNVNEGCCNVAWQCPSMHYHPQCWHPPTSSGCSILRTVMSPPLQNITRLVHSEMLKEDTNVLLINKWKKQCMHNFLANQKHFLLRASTNLWFSGLSTLKKRVVM